jgi:hypothetical protein
VLCLLVVVGWLVEVALFVLPEPWRSKVIRALPSHWPVG